MTEICKLAAILVADVVGYSRLASADEERTLARLRALLGDLIEPAIAVHRGRIVKRTGDGFLAEFRSVVDAARSAIETQTGMLDRNAGLAPERRIELRIGIHLGDVVEEADGDLMGDGVNIAARLESLCAPGAICLVGGCLSAVKGRLDAPVNDLGPKQLRTLPPSRSGLCARRRPTAEIRRCRPRRRRSRARHAARLSSCRSPISGATPDRSISRRGHGEPETDLRVSAALS